MLLCVVVLCFADQNMEVTVGMIFAQATNFFSSSPFDIFAATSELGTVTYSTENGVSAVGRVEEDAAAVAAFAAACSMCLSMCGFLTPS